MIIHGKSLSSRTRYISVIFEHHCCRCWRPFKIDPAKLLQKEASCLETGIPLPILLLLLLGEDDLLLSTLLLRMLSSTSMSSYADTDVAQSTSRQQATERNSCRTGDLILPIYVQIEIMYLR